MLVISVQWTSKLVSQRHIGHADALSANGD